jgi:hypothetical protein
MDPIREAIAEIKSRAPDASFSYSQVAKRYGVGRVTLARRHRGETQLREIELVQHIILLTKRRTPLSRTMTRNFASSLAGKEVSESWVTGSMSRNSTHLISRWQTGMDRDHHEANLEAMYSLYFKLLHEK